MEEGYYMKIVGEGVKIILLKQGNRSDLEATKEAISLLKKYV
jgi:hypothetical protein